MRRLRSRGIVWIALAAIALQALWPLIAQAKPKSVLLVPVCTVQGVTHYIELAKGNAPIEQKAASQHDHCSFCVLGAALPVGCGPAILACASCEAPISFEDRFLPGHTLLSAHSRAPPALS